MLNSLYINNYRNLKDLKINSLGSVNLIAGKNNTGKSALLEAIAIYATNGDINLIYKLIDERGETLKKKNEKGNQEETNVKILSSLFTNRIAGFDTAVNSIFIGECKNTFEETLSPNNCVLLRFAKVFDELSSKEQRSTKNSKLFTDDIAIEKVKIGFQINTRNGINIYTLDNDIPYRFSTNDNMEIKHNVQFVRTRNFDRGVNGSLFDKIALTDKEQHVINALKIIEPLVERIAFVEEPFNERTAVIKLSDSQQILPLQSMGDGINRILTIILALVNADKGHVLIDEFENGLHYSVQEKLWTIIFKLSSELNIQVFVTTHSDDCIRGFESALNQSNNASNGKLIRLDNVNGIIRQVDFDARELKIATDQNIEIR